MGELVENQTATLRPKIEIMAAGAQNDIDGIERCTGRLRRLIELKAPMAIVKNEIRMIQYRALQVEAGYEALALMEFVFSEKRDRQTGDVRT